MCCSSKSVEVIDSSSRYPLQHGNYKKSINEILMSQNNSSINIPESSTEKKTLISKGEKALENGNYSEVLQIIKNWYHIIPKMIVVILV